MAAVAERLAGAVFVATEKEKNLGERLAPGERGGSAWRERGKVVDEYRQPTVNSGTIVNSFK
jgi:hypothetical protein